MRLFCLLALLLAPLASDAQSFGVRAGLNLADIRGLGDNTVDDVQPGARLGLIAGVTARLPLSPTLALQPEVLFSQKGFEIASVEDAGRDVRIDYALSYIEVPVLARIALPVGPFAEGGVLLGPALAFEVNEDIDVIGDDPPTDDEFLGLSGSDGESVFATIDLGLVIGADYGSGPYSVDLRYTYGLLDLNEAEAASSPSISNGVFSVTGAVRFGR